MLWGIFFFNTPSKFYGCGTTLAVQWSKLCLSVTGGIDLIPGHETGILYVAWCDQKIKFKKFYMKSCIVFISSLDLMGLFLKITLFISLWLIGKTNLPCIKQHLYEDSELFCTFDRGLSFELCYKIWHLLQFCITQTWWEHFFLNWKTATKLTAWSFFLRSLTNYF